MYESNKGFFKMKCSYALKKHLKSNLSDSLKQKIDDHISTCPFCQEQLETSEKIGDLLGDRETVNRDETFWSSLLIEIKSFRERMEESWMDRINFSISSLFTSRTAFASAASAAVIFIMIAVFSVNIFKNEDQIATDVNEELDYLIQEHFMIQQSEIFDHGTFSHVSEKNIKKNEGKEPYRN